MNDHSRIRGYLPATNPFGAPLDAVLADIAIIIQLPPGLHGTACDRYEAIRQYVVRPGSPLFGLVVQLYPQGSMAIDATTSTRGTDNEYDLDAVLEAEFPARMTPGMILDLTYEALKDYPVDAEVLRQTRCVTIRYADGMHVDVTPARRRPRTIDFESVIFHAKPEEPQHRHVEVPMNAYGFAAWYRDRTPEEVVFAEAFRLRAFEDWNALAKSDPVFHDVPDQTPFPRKSVTTVALQLLKRFRDIWSLDQPGRFPPSVMLSCHAGHASQQGLSLSEMVIRQSRWTARAINSAARLGCLIDVRNPVMHEDRFTDRWPENQHQQGAFAAALTDFADCLDFMLTHDTELEDMQEVLRKCFGAQVVNKSVRVLNEQTGRALRGGSQGYTSRGGLFVPAAPAIVGTAAAASVVPARAHTNMGERRP